MLPFPTGAGDTALILESFGVDLASEARGESHFEFHSDVNVDVVDAGALSQHPIVLAESLSTATVSTLFRNTDFSPEIWPTIASPPRSLDNEFDCETESPLISLVKVISEVSDTPPGAKTGTPHGGYYSRGRCSSTESQFTLSEYLDPEPLPDLITFSGFLESPTRNSHHLGSSAISRAFRFTESFPQQGLCIRTGDANDEQTLQCRIPCQTCSTPPSPSFASSSRSSLGDPISPSSSSSFLRRKFRLRSPGGDSPTRVKSLFNTTDEYSRGPPSPSTNLSWPQSVPCSPVTATAPVTLSHRQLLNSSITISSGVSCPPTPTIYLSKIPNTPNFEYLPDKLSWLKDIHLELWIDQEGFRAARALFKPVGFSNLPRSLEPFGSDSDPFLENGIPPSNLHAGIVDFMPVKRQIFIFHRSALDSSPVLRRITVNGDEGYDYLSRQASLTLKNGVYTVRGHETSSLFSHTDPAIVGVDTSAKLKWKLEYIVRDRKAETSGKIINGEKTFTPLTFSCAPLLLHPLRRKKVRLMQVVKKSVTANILAEKLEPPKPPISNPVLLPLKLKTNVILLPHTVHPSMTDARNMHRRAYSHVPDENMSPRIPPSASKRIERQVNTNHVRRRRASSAGEGAFGGRVSGEGEACIEGLAPARNILPRSQGNGMLDLSAEGTSTQPRSGNNPLSPPDYHTEARLAAQRTRM